MKSFRSTAIMLVVVCGLVGYAFWDHQKTEKEELKKAEAEKLFSFSAADIKGLKVVRPTETMVLSYKSDQWLIEQPVADRANNDDVVGHLTAISNEKGTLLKSGEVKWADYFLDTPGATFQLTKADQPPIEFTVSRLAAFDGNYYVRKGDSLYLGSSAWARYGEKSANQLRDKEIFPASDPVVGIILESGTKRLTLQKATDQWQVAGGKGPKLDNAKVEKWIEGLKQTKASDFAKEPKTDSAALAKYKLNKPALRITVQFVPHETKTDEKTLKAADWTLSISEELNKNNYAIHSLNSAIYTIDKSHMESLNVTVNDLRDGHPPFQLAVDEVHQVEISTPDTQLKVVKEGSDWKPTNLPAGKNFNSGNFAQLFEKFGKLEAREFRAKADAKNLKNSVQFKAATGKTLLALSWGETYKADSAAHKGESFYYAKSSLSDETLGMSAEDINGLPIKNLIETPPPPVIPEPKAEATPGDHK